MQMSTVAPILFLDKSELLEKGFNFTENLSISLAPAWFTAKEFKDQLTDDIVSTIESTRFVFEFRYEAHSWGDLDPLWTGERTRTLEQRAIEEIQFANLSLWLAHPTPLTFSTLIQCGKGLKEWHRFLYFENRHLELNVRDLDNNLNAEDLEKARQIFLSINTLQRKGSVWIAIRTTLEALSEDWWEGRFLFLWVAMEALFGPRDAKEVSFRLAQRISFFLNTDSNDAQIAFTKTKKSYIWRSKVAHGVPLNKLSGDTSEQVLHDTENLLRLAINRILLNSQILAQFNGNHREEYLDGLPYNFGKPTPA